MPSPEKFSDYLAVLALLISCASFYLSWRNFRRDASRLKLRLDFQVYTGRGSAYLIKITNTGRRLATVTKVSARLKRDGLYPVFEAKRSLAETETMELSVPLAGFTSSLRHPLDISTIQVEDSAGKIYKVRTWKLWRHIRKVWTPDVDWISNNNSKAG